MSEFISGVELEVGGCQELSCDEGSREGPEYSFMVHFYLYKEFLVVHQWYAWA